MNAASGVPPGENQKELPSCAGQAETSRATDPSGVGQVDTSPAADPWASLRQFTAARIALGSTGVSIPVGEVLQFKLAHAHARDAVFSSLAENEISVALSLLSLSPVSMQSQAKDRTEYLQRPDLGRRLSDHSLQLIKGYEGRTVDVALIVADGLSAEAVNRHAVPLLTFLLPMFETLSLSLSPVAIVKQGRVAVGDEIGEAFAARLSLLMIGERPGLSSPDSLGVYLTYKPKHGLTDESRNCISNIRPEGLQYEAAAMKTFYLVREALRLRLTGISLKEQATALPG